MTTNTIWIAYLMVIPATEVRKGNTHLAYLLMEGDHGAEFLVSETCIKALAENPQNGTLWTYCHQGAQNGEQTWYGFFADEERLLFKTMLTLDGIGPAIAMKILSGTHYLVLLQKARAGDEEFLSSVPGGGPKTGATIAAGLIKAMGAKVVKKEKAKPEAKRVANADLVSALTGLGYPKLRAYEIALEVELANPGAALDVLVKKALKFPTEFKV